MTVRDDDKALRFTFSIPADHPALAGHFPGEPVVPGVILLDQVLSRLTGPANAPRRLAWVKFTRALLPAQLATATLSEDEAGWRFTVLRGEDLLAQGLITRQDSASRAEP